MPFFIIFVLFDFFFTTLANYEYICNKNLLRKPYVNIYNTRQGNSLELNEIDGFYDVSHLKNIYVCINGPAWLFIKHYTKMKSLASEVYDDPIYDVWVHECKFYNGIGGPGSSTKKPDQLKGIYLLGDSKDYARPSLALFTAPYLIKENSEDVYRNVTSIVMINAHQCKILKGPNKIPMRFDVRLNDGEAKLERMCLFPYQNVTSWIKEEAGDGDNTTPQKTAVERFLINNDGITKGECTNQNDKNARSASQIKSNIQRIKNESEALKVVFDADFPTAPEEKQSTEIEAKETEIKTLKDNDQNWMKTSTRATVAEREKELAQLKLQYEYYTMYKNLKPDSGDVFTKLTEKADEKIDGFAAIDDTQKIVDDKIVEIAKLNQDRVNLLNNISLSDIQKEEGYEQLVEKFQKIKEELSNNQTELEEKFKDLLPEESKMEVELLKIEEQLRLLRLLKAASENSVKARNINVNDLPLHIEIDKERTNDTCTKLPEVGRQDYFAPAEGSCNTKRGQKLMGCQLLRASMGNPGICSFKPDEVDKPFQDSSTPGGKVDSPDNDPAEGLNADVTEFIPKHMLDVLDLIESIYPTACTKIKPIRFAKRVHNILKCYIIQSRLSKEFNATNVPTASKLRFWGKIMEALRDCKIHKHELVFRKESQKSNKYYLYKENPGNKDGEYLEVPFMKEQADNEFGFNFAIDMSWKIFATVLGLCMPSYENKIPLITSRFFTLYTEEFLQPLADTWTSTNDNNVFKRVLSSYYGVGGSETWASYCMEGSYIYSSDISYRPPRKLLVNDKSEYNYFVGKDGKYKPVKNSNTGCTAACKDKQS